MASTSFGAESPVDKRQGVFVESSIADVLQRKLDAYQDLMAVVSHELRTPLNAMILAASSIANRVSTDPAYMKEARIIRRASDQILRLVSDLLDTSLLQVGRLGVVPRPCAVEDLMRQIVELLEPHAREKNIQLRVDREINLTILADPERMVQVLCNLITNAIKFTPRNGIVMVNAIRRGTSVLFGVRDNGVGIDSTELPRIFEQYWQSAQTWNGGSGLGLFIAKALIDAHGGRISVESEVGQGTTFYFTIPAVATIHLGHETGQKVQ